MKKPLGIKLIIALSLLGGTLFLTIEGMMVFALADRDNLVITFLFLSPFILFSALYFIVAYGLWTIKPWALKFSTGVYTLGALIGLFFLVQPIISGDTIEIRELFENLFGFILTIAIVRYLSLTRIKKIYIQSL